MLARKKLEASPRAFCVHFAATIFGSQGREVSLIHSLRLVEYSPEKAALYHWVDRESIGILRVTDLGDRNCSNCPLSMQSRASSRGLLAGIDEQIVRKSSPAFFEIDLGARIE